MSVARVAVGRIWQETNSFSQRQTTRADFERSDWLCGDALLAAMPSRDDELAGFADALGEAACECVPLICASCWPGGPAEPALVEAIFDRLDDALDRSGQIDGVLVSLHGAMSSDAVPDVEAAVLARIRAQIGPDVPLVATLDHHANVTAAMLDAVDAVTAYRHCPHVDLRRTGRRGARLLVDIMKGRLKPAMAWQKLPLVTPCERFMTDEGPMADWFATARRLETRHGIRDISLFPVQPWIDVPEFGWSVVVVGNAGQEAELARAADRLADHAWAHRRKFSVDKWAPTEAVAYAAAARGPVVLADGADATNGGSPGDSPQLLAELIAQRVERPAYLTMVDPAAVAKAKAAGQGAWITVDIGAGTSTAFHTPLRLTARVERLKHGRFAVSGHIGADVDIGCTALLAVGAIRVVVSEHAGPGHDPAIYRHMGLAPEDAQIVVVKCTVGHMRAFGPIMTESLAVECRGPSPSSLERLPYSRPSRPLYPLDPEMSWSPQ